MLYSTILTSQTVHILLTISLQNDAKLLNCNLDRVCTLPLDMTRFPAVWPGYRDRNWHVGNC